MNAKLQWLRNKMASLDLQGLILTNPINIRYLTNIEAEGILLLITKIKKTDEYIPFGPFIVIATFISMYIPFETIKLWLMQIFTLGMYHG